MTTLEKLQNDHAEAEAAYRLHLDNPPAVHPGSTAWQLFTREAARLNQVRWQREMMVVREMRLEAVRK